MIKNDREYKITQSRIAKFKQALQYLAAARAQGKFEKATIELQEVATKSIVQTLKEELREYDKVRSGNYDSKLKDQFELADALPVSLIRARVALNWTQKDLANRVGTSERQIQRYEATDYQSASLATIRRISGVMQEHLENRRR